MRKLAQFQTLFSACGVAIAVVLDSYLGRWLDPRGIPKGAALVLYLVAVGLTYLLFRVVADSLIENSKWLRQMLLGSRFVEGTWLELVQSGDKRFASILCVAFENQALRLSGQNFDQKGQPLGSFRSVMVVLDWPILKYKYDWAASGTRRPNEGYGEISFAEVDGAPVLFQGFFIDLDDGQRRTLWGERVKGADALSALGDPERRPKMIHDFAEDRGLTPAETAASPTETSVIPSKGACSR